MQTETSIDVLFDKRRQEYLAQTRELFSAYIHKPKQLKSDLLLSLCGWEQVAERRHGSYFSFADHQALFDAKNCRLQEGGYFLSLNQKGICLNPGKTFFDKLCQKGYTLQDIDIVIATRADGSIEEEIRQLFSLNRECSRTLLSYGQKPKHIRFFLHPALYASLASLFRPVFREELNCTTSLETFSESGETISLDDLLTLSYAKSEGAGLAIRLDAEELNLSFGYLSGGGFTPDLEAFFSPCTLMLLGLGECTPNDFEKVALQKHDLGFYGLSVLLRRSEVVKLALICEFSREAGDLRLELVQKLSREQSVARILPIDRDFCLHLDTCAIQTSNRTFCSYEDVKVVRPYGSFGPLLYLGPEDIL